MPVRRTRKDDGSQWTAADSRSIYGIRHWGAGYFAINDQGNVEVRPQGPSGEPIEFNEDVCKDGTVHGKLAGRLQLHHSIDTSALTMGFVEEDDY